MKAELSGRVVRLKLIECPETVLSMSTSVVSPLLISLLGNCRILSSPSLTVWYLFKKTDYLCSANLRFFAARLTSILEIAIIPRIHPRVATSRRDSWLIKKRANLRTILSVKRGTLRIQAAKCFKIVCSYSFIYNFNNANIFSLSKAASSYQIKH